MPLFSAKLVFEIWWSTGHKTRQLRPCLLSMANSCSSVLKSAKSKSTISWEYFGSFG